MKLGLLLCFVDSEFSSLHVCCEALPAPFLPALHLSAPEWANKTKRVAAKWRLVCIVQETPIVTIRFPFETLETLEFKIGTKLNFLGSTPSFSLGSGHVTELWWPDHVQCAFVETCAVAPTRRSALSGPSIRWPVRVRIVADLRRNLSRYRLENSIWESEMCLRPWYRYCVQSNIRGRCWSHFWCHDGESKSTTVHGLKPQCIILSSLKMM